MKKQIAALNSKISDAAQSDFENANNIAFFCRRAWDTGKGSYSRLSAKTWKRPLPAYVKH